MDDLNSTIVSDGPGHEGEPGPSGEAERCPVCGWPFAASVAHGCVPGNCSMRPRPNPTWDEASQAWNEMEALRANAERIHQQNIALRATLLRVHLLLEGFAESEVGKGWSMLKDAIRSTREALEAVDAQ